MNEKRQQTYEKRVLKQIQEDTIDQLPKCDDFPSFKVVRLLLLHGDTLVLMNGTGLSNIVLVGPLRHTTAPTFVLKWHLKCERPLPGPHIVEYH